MTQTKRLLLLAGTGQARRLASVLAQTDGVSVTASLAGATRDPIGLAVQTRVGGFGGANGLRQYLKDAAIDILLDATHPFAAQMTSTAARVAQELGLAHAVVQRSGWTPRAQDRWHFVDRLEEAADLIPKDATVFLGTGRGSLRALANLAPRAVIARVIDPPTAPFPFAGGRFAVGRPPFSVAEESRFFKVQQIDWLVVKNSGGTESFSKLEAAARLGLPVVLQSRPALPDAIVFETETKAMNWVKGLL